MSIKTITEPIKITDPVAIDKFWEIYNSEQPANEIQPTSKESKEAVEEFAKEWWKDIESKKLK